MTLINEYFLRLQGSYLFSEIAKRVRSYKARYPDEKVISLGIGDVTRPLAPAVVEAMHKAVDEMAHEETFRGYPPENGYSFLIDAIIEHDFNARGVRIDPDEVFVSDGAKSDTGNFGDVLGLENRVAVTDPVYPVYVDSNAMAGRAGHYADGAWSKITYLPCVPDNDFVPELPAERPDVVYLCYPNNPTGTTLTKNELKRWVDYALENETLILFDAAYEAFISDENIPHSIYEIEDAKRVAVEFRSLSKTAGFTGVRCGYVIVPKELLVRDKAGNTHSLNRLWFRRQSTKFNGTSYITQRGAEAIYSAQGKKQVRDTLRYYMDNARIIKQGLESIGMKVYGGVNAPYIWLKTPDGLSSWEFFDRLLNECRVIGTPGAGFGKSGEGFFRLTAFGKRSETSEAVELIKNKYGGLI